MSGRSTSIVTVSYHTGPVLFHAIERMLAEPELAELMVVNNGNPPPVEARLQALAASEPRLKFISGHGNVGFARACNLGARHATGEYLLLLNPDCLVEHGILEQLRLALEAHPQAMLAGGLLLNPDGTEQRGGRRELLTPLTAVSESLGLHRFLRVRRLNAHETPIPTVPAEVSAISGACMFLRRSDYDRLSGMDEGYFLHVEDLDFCLRVHRAGGNILFMPQARAVHMLGTSDISSLYVEWCKTKGFMRYFRLHFGSAYSRPVLWAANLGILARFALKAMLQPLRRYRGPRPSAIAGHKLMLLLEARAQHPSSALDGMSVAVTGASSPLGMLITGRLLGAGAEVIAVSRSPGLPLTLTGLRWQRGDLTHPGFALTEKADCAIHCAPLWILPPALEALARAGVKRIVAFGSTSLFGKADSADPYEQKVLRNLRTTEQQTAEHCAALGIALTILRPTLIYGTGLDGNVSRIAHTLRRFRAFPVYPPACGLRQPVHAADLAQAALACLRNEQTYGQTYDVSGGETLSYRAMVERVAHALNRRSAIVPLPFLPRALDVMGRLFHNSRVNGEMARRMNRDLIFSHEAAACDFGYAPRVFLSGGLSDLTGLP